MEIQINVIRATIKTMMGATASNFTDDEIDNAFSNAMTYVADYCNRSVDSEILLSMAEKIAICDLNKQGSEGTQSESYSGISQTFVDGYPTEIMKILDKKRKIKLL